MEETDNICFVCDQNIPLEKWKYQLQVTATKRRNAPVADLIQDLVGDEFEVLVGERDAICSKCMNLINLMDSLTFQLGEVRSTLIKLLHSKYNLAEDIQLQVEYDDSTHEDREPLHKCEFCNYQTKYEKEFNMHSRTHTLPKSVKSPLSEKQDVSKKAPSSKFSSKSKSKITKKKSPKKNKLPIKKAKSIKKSPKDKKKKIVYQCGVCNQVFPDENAIRLHCKKVHGNDKIVVSDEEEYDDIQTLESSSDEEIILPKEDQKNKSLKRNKVSTKTKLDFLDDWLEDEDNDDLHSPVKRPKTDQTKSESASTKRASIKTLFRSSLRDSFDELEDEDNEKDTSSQPTCLFCQTKFSSFDAVRDHVKLYHGNRSNLSLSKVKSKPDTASASVASFEINSTTDIAEKDKKATMKKLKPKVKLFKCTFCGIKKVSKKFIKEHIKMHKRKMSLQCKKCGVTFKKIISLKVHAFKCHRVGSLLVKCRKCKFKFIDLTQLKNHVKKVHRKSNPKKKVNFGQRVNSIGRNENQSIHDSASATKANNMKTDSCMRISLKKPSSKTDDSKISVSEVSSTSIETSIHKKRRYEKRRPSGEHRCVECNVSFKQYYKIQLHRVRHLVLTCSTLGVCVFCEKLFLNPEHLTIHNKAVHEKLQVKPACTHCPKKYTLMKDLRLHHLRSHFSEKAEKMVKQVTEYKNKDNKTKANAENDVYNKVFKELQDLTGEGDDVEEVSVNEEKLSPLTFSCPVCDFASQDDDDLKNHLPSHVQHYCNICETLFCPEKVINHLENHSIDFQGLKCSMCDRECHDNIHLQAHTQTHSETKSTGTNRIKALHKQNIVQCNMCGKSFVDEKRLQLHKASKHGKKTKKILTCRECKSDFFSEGMYQNHIEFAHRSGLNCKYCDKSLDSIKKLIVHEKGHLKEIKSIIKCNICGKVLKSVQALKAHRSLHKSNDSTCEVCNKSFKSYHSLREHSASHSNQQEKKYFCEICGKGFYFYDSHARHRTVHLDPLNFQCKNCKVRFQTKLKLIDHKKTCNINNKEVK